MKYLEKSRLKVYSAQTRVELLKELVQVDADIDSYMQKVSTVLIGEQDRKLYSQIQTALGGYRRVLTAQQNDWDVRAAHERPSRFRF